ncbi:MAG: guanylate kinase [Oscillospiraceae bacterium]|jgi:guanylate kinase|nr:guanylate kinase [Oscillospiraceae bacterium]
MRNGRLLIISAPSGTGKGTVIGVIKALNPDIAYSISCTTRAPRAGEIDGTHYHFVSHQRFEEMLEQDAFLEHAEYSGNLYGTPRGFIADNMARGIDTILEIEVVGARLVRAQLPDAQSVLLLPPSVDELTQRLRGRGDLPEDELARRLDIAQSEIAAADEFDLTVVNDTPERAAREILDFWALD